MSSYNGFTNVLPRLKAEDFAHDVKLKAETSLKKPIKRVYPVALRLLLNDDNTLLLDEFTDQ